MTANLGAGTGLRPDGRTSGRLRPSRFTRAYTRYAEGSVLVELGDTRILCTATVENRVPPWLRDAGSGWVTAEYDMLPRATSQRTGRDRGGKVSGRTQEIQRLIGRALRAVTDLRALGERTIILDCDVLQADGGTRTAAITGAFVALADALAAMRQEADWAVLPLTDWLAAVSVGVVDGMPLLDLNYAEDAEADVDMNVAGTGRGNLVEIQGSAEGAPFSETMLLQLLSLARTGIAELVAAQQAALSDVAQLVGRWPATGDG